MKLSNKLNIILGSLLLVNLVIIFLLIFYQSKYKQKTVEDNENILIEYAIKENYYIKRIENRNKQIVELNKTKPKTEKEIIYKEIIEKDTELIEDLQIDNKSLKDQLDKTNDVLKRQNSKKNTIKAFGLAGGDENFNIDIYTGIMYDRTVYSGKLIDFKIGIGGAVKLLQNRGGAGTIQLSISF